MQINQLQEALLAFITEAFSVTPEQGAGIDFTLNTDESKQVFGDISCNAAMILAKPLGKSPRDIAQHIAANFKNENIAKLEIAGPGFLNVFLTKKAFASIAQELFIKKEECFKPIHFTKHHYNLEFVSANPTGPLHLGHGRGGIIGDVLGNILRFVGHSVTKEYYINDAGNQMERLGQSFKIRCLQVMGEQMDIPEDGYRGDYLIDLAQECYTKYGTALRTEPDTFFSRYAEKHMLEQIKQTLAAYGISFDVWFSERSLHEDGAITKAMQVLTDNGFTYEQDGAVWFTSQQFGDDKDRVLKKSDGSLTYVAADIAYMQNKLSRGADKLILVLGQDHHSYVVRLKGILQALGYNANDLDVILYQLVTIKQDGEQLRMSKRAGTGVTLQDIIDTVGSDVARFFYLNRKADAHLDFDLGLALKKTEENPVYYIQYAYVRTNSILDKSQEVVALRNITADDAHYLDDSEQLLLKKILSLQSLLAAIAANNQTHLLTYYVHELAQLFHKYYAKNKVIDAENIPASRGRLLMVKLVHDTMHTCLTLLGLNLPERM
ncbi:MAG: arginine--tRNA ligase [Candidatus Babeliales bacterium]